MHHHESDLSTVRSHHEDIAHIKDLSIPNAAKVLELDDQRFAPVVDLILHVEIIRNHKSRLKPFAELDLQVIQAMSVQKPAEELIPLFFETEINRTSVLNSDVEAGINSQAEVPNIRDVLVADMFEPPLARGGVAESECSHPVQYPAAGFMELLVHEHDISVDVVLDYHACFSWLEIVSGFDVNSQHTLSIVRANGIVQGSVIGEDEVEDSVQNAGREVVEVRILLHRIRCGHFGLLRSSCGASVRADRRY